jgi:peptidoglycan/xylan/chitin deacetylase (PgdA/CDA1 family)
MYHSVGYNEQFFTVTPEAFSRQMAHLKTGGYKVLSLKDVIDMLVSRTKIPPRTVVLTFDDGYEDNFTHAFPILRQYNYLATIFISTNFIGEERPVRETPMRHLTRKQILEMHDSKLIDFQPHGLSHSKLINLSPNDIEREMKASKELLEELLGSTCNIFSYPFGSSDANVHALARKLFVGAVGVKRGYVSQTSDIINLRRQSIDSKTSFSRFLLKI